MPDERRARIDDIGEHALALPGVTVVDGSSGNPVYQVRNKSFIFFRNPRPDALDESTGERLTDVIAFWVATDADKQALVEDTATPFFTTPHFDGYPAVLVRASRIGELTRTELVEVIEEAWLSRAPKRLAAAWAAENPASNRNASTMNLRAEGQAK